MLTWKICPLMPQQSNWTQAKPLQQVFRFGQTATATTATTVINGANSAGSVGL